MAYQYKLGKNLATGTPKGVQTGLGKANGDTSTVVVTIEGPLAAMESLVPAQGATSTDLDYIPAGCYVQSARLSSDGRGKGTITINCVDPGADSSQSPASPSKITYRIEMAEEQTDLIAHPVITETPSILNMCIKWLATDDAKKIADNGDYQYDEGDGSSFTKITDETAIKFCQAWMHGIKTFNRYFPVIEKISTYKRVPGLTLSGAKITGGTANFSDDIGKWDVPDIALQGYGSTGYFKSKDSWEQQAKSSWTRTEQWVWTPDGSDSDFGWIYDTSSNS